MLVLGEDPGCREMTETGYMGNGRSATRLTLICSCLPTEGELRDCTKTFGIKKVDLSSLPFINLTAAAIRWGDLDWQVLRTVVKIVDWSWMGGVLSCMNVSLQTQESLSTEFTKRLTWTQTYDHTMRQLVLTAATNVNELNTTIKVAAGGEHTTKPPLPMKVCVWESETGTDIWRDNVLKIYSRYV